MEMMINYKHKTVKAIYEISNKQNISSEKTLKLVRATLHSIRDNMSSEESIQFLTQLSPSFKNIYLENWKPSKNEYRQLDKSDLLSEIKNRLNGDVTIRNLKEEELIKKLSFIISYLLLGASVDKIEEIFIKIPGLQSIYMD